MSNLALYCFFTYLCHEIKRENALKNLTGASSASGYLNDYILRIN